VDGENRREMENSDARDRRFIQIPRAIKKITELYGKDFIRAQKPVWWAFNGE
jgi:hypothetical protein